MRCEVTVKPISNGWLCQIDIANEPLEIQYYESELAALAAAHTFFEKAIELTIKETQQT